MTRKRLLALSLISAAAALGVGGAAATLKTGLPEAVRSEFVELAASADWGGPHRRHGGAHGDIEQRTARLIDFVEDAFRFDPNQQAAWRELAKRLRAAAATFDDAHEDPPVEGLGAKERLARAETSLAAGLAALRSIRPAFDAFYDTLTPAQRKSLDAFAAHRHHSRKL
jgi:hypothetical protein